MEQFGTICAWRLDNFTLTCELQAEITLPHTDANFGTNYMNI